MKFIDHPLFLSVVFFCGVVGTIGVILLSIQHFAEGHGFVPEVFLFGLFWFWGAWSSGSRLFGFKPTLIRLELEKYAEDLMAIPYEKALEDARANSTPVPRELALRKIKPSSEEWFAFEKDGIPFLLEKHEPGGRTKVTLYK